MPDVRQREHHKPVGSGFVWNQILVSEIDPLSEDRYNVVR